MTLYKLCHVMTDEFAILLVIGAERRGESKLPIPRHLNKPFGRKRQRIFYPTAFLLHSTPTYHIQSEYVLISV